MPEPRRSQRAPAAIRRVALVSALLLGLSSAVGCGGGDEGDDAGDAGSNWDEMSWDQGTWS